ncbi:MAG: hypothetical protein IPP97_25705 [Candidatus Obscuribacter sp.]|nr:hypothetical protein [Candidatus Obscuribacter sp.]MBP9798468.1 hypothetical protein [Candidatus Woesebacteria bacterium]
MKIFYQSIIMIGFLLYGSSTMQAMPIENSDSDSLEPLVSVYPISMISVLTNPDRYKGKRCRISGYLHLEFEDHHLYFSKEFADHLATENSIHVCLDEDVHLEPARKITIKRSTITEVFKNIDENGQSVPERESAKARSKVTPKHFNKKVVMLEGTFDDTLNLEVSRIVEF